MKLYGYWRSAATFRVRIALNFKSLAYEEIMHDLLKGEQFAETYKAVNPQMVVPALQDGDSPMLFQSLAILEYLEERYPQPPLLPADAFARARARGIALIAAADAHPFIVPRVRKYLEQELHLDEATRTTWIQHWMDEASQAIEQHLEDEPGTARFCCGEAVSIADVCLVAHMVPAKLFGCDVKKFPIAHRITEECLRIDAFARAHPLKQSGAPANH